MAHTSVDYKKLEWIQIENVGAKDIEYLAKRFNFHPLDLEDCLSNKQHTKIDSYDDYNFMVLQFPHKKRGDGHLGHNEVDIFISDRYLVTINHGNKALRKLAKKVNENADLQKKYFGHGTGYLLYKVFKRLVNESFDVLTYVETQLTSLEKRVFATDSNRDCLQEILLLKKDIIHFRRIMVNQWELLQELMQKRFSFVTKKLLVYFDDLNDGVVKISNSLELAKEMISAIQETNESMISHNTNDVIKALTFISVIMLPLTVITGIYGMNIATLPFAESPNSFLIITGLMVVVITLMLSFFKFRRWFWVLL